MGAFPGELSKELCTEDDRNRSRPTDHSYGRQSGGFQGRLHCWRAKLAWQLAGAVYVGVLRMMNRNRCRLVIVFVGFLVGIMLRMKYTILELKYVCLQLGPKGPVMVQRQPFGVSLKTMPREI